jgi:class 3 adenylate cyclase
MGTCPQCAKELPGEFPFCPFCGAAVGERPLAHASIERKVVSVLFCDLVGFTAASDAADPEDVRARIRPYHQQLKREIEGFGGTVEKFIGDAVMAVFGAPVAHEDDAERAVRAALRILAAIEQLNVERPALQLEVRVGINTGEAVVDRAARPERGEGIVVGDVVNTAARLQAAAPVGGIAVGELTYRQTRRIFEYEELERVTAKGKAKPLAIWAPIVDRPRFGRDPASSQVTPLVGRASELSRVRTAFELAAGGPSVRMVTLLGEPGIGKSRLLMELSSHGGRLPQMIRWRQGGCLPYGEGITFWALGEIVKAHAGVFETDSPERAAEKLDAVLPEVEERAWLRARLLPLLGVDPRQPPSREESFTAWRRFIESIAADGPAVVAVEDLHWADAALLDFLVYLAAASRGAPLLVLCTARPELLERYPAWGAATPNAETINLSPLSEGESASLVQALLTRDADEHVRRAVLERAGGNPLYAEELAHFIAEGGLNGRGDGGEFPDSLQALITARLDTLTQEQKRLLLDASVVGSVFWVDALAHMGEHGADEAKRILDELSRRQFVRPALKSSMESEVEYSFWHVLVRDVAYGQIPRAERARRHRAAAAWTELKAGERVEDFAELLANHYVAALALSEASGEAADTAGLAISARRYLALAGARALGLDPAQAKSRLERALELTPDDDRERPALILRWADAAFQTGHLREAADRLDAALASLRQAGERELAARALMLRSRIARRLNDPRHLAFAGEAVVLLEEIAPGVALVDAYTQLALVQFTQASLDCVSTAERAISLAEALGLPIPARALGCRGVTRAYLGDTDGIDEAERALHSCPISRLSVTRSTGRRRCSRIWTK